MLFGVLIHNVQNPNAPKFTFGVRARSISEATDKTMAILKVIEKRNGLVKAKDDGYAIEITKDGVNNAADIVAWAGIESSFAYGKYKDKPFMRVRYTDNGPVIKGGYIGVNVDTWSISTLYESTVDNPF